MTADVVRRILLGRFRASGRYHVDVERLVAEPGSETPSVEVGPAEQESVRGAVDRFVASRTGGDAGGLTQEDARRLVEAAIRAPSGGNDQPWHFAYHPEAGLLLFHARERSKSALDFDRAGAYVSLGAAIENAVLAGQASGRAMGVELLPESGWVGGRPLVARLYPTAPDRAEPATFLRLADQIPRRHTQRHLGPRVPLPDGVGEALEAAVASIPGATVTILDDPTDLADLADLAGRADRVRMLDERQHASMMEELRWTAAEAEDTRDGLDVRTLELSDSDRAGLELCRSAGAMRLLDQLDLGQSLTDFSRRRMAASSAAALITMPGPGAHATLNGGRALQRMWLTATEHDLALQPMGALPFLFKRVLYGGGEGLSAEHVNELLDLRRRYERLFSIASDRSEIMLVRLFFAAPAATRALRRPVSEVFEPFG